MCALPRIKGAIVDRTPDTKQSLDLEPEVADMSDEKTVECEFFDQSCARDREPGDDLSTCFGSKKCRDEAEGGVGEGGDTEAFCYTVWQNGTGLPGAWNIKRQGCLFNHGSSQVCGLLFKKVSQGSKFYFLALKGLTNDPVLQSQEIIYFRLRLHRFPYFGSSHSHIVPLKTVF